MLKGIVWIGQMRKTVSLTREDSVSIDLHSFVRNICVLIINGHVAMVSSYSHYMRSMLLLTNFFEGQYVGDDTNRHQGIRYSEFQFCLNMRDVNYMCEAVKRNSKSWWTIDNGYC